MDGIAKAKEKGVKFGAQKKLTDEDVADLKASRQAGMLIKDVMKTYGLSKASVYRYLEAIENVAAE